MTKLGEVKQKGMVSGLMAVAILLLAVSLPVTVLLVQRNQENRSSAASEAEDYDFWEEETDLTDVGGECGTADGKSYAVRPTADLCRQGTEVWSDSSGSEGSYLWSCVAGDGINIEGVVANCAAVKVAESEGGSIDGRCGEANGGNYESRPISGYLLCKSGEIEWTDEDETDGNLGWNCGGVNEGETVSCWLSLFE